MGWRQPGHLTQRPSVRTFLVPASGPFSAAGPPASEEYSPSSRLNQDIPHPIANGGTGFSSVTLSGFSSVTHRQQRSRADHRPTGSSSKTRLLPKWGRYMLNAELP